MEETIIDYKNNNEVINKRIDYIDVARGIAILLMIIGHVLTVGGWKRNIIFSFHMPLFVIASGFFFKENEKFSVMIRKALKTLIIPFLIIIFLDTLFEYIMKDKNILETITDFLKRILVSYSADSKISYDFTRALGAM